MRVLVTGAGGQVGARVVERLGAHDVLAAAHDVLDLADREQVEQVVATFGPEAVVNAAALTNVDECERDPERAFAVNALGVRNLAVAAERAGAHVVHISTDYVFDGESTRPYDEWDAVAPLSEYGRSKLGGERELMAHAQSWAIVRTSWVFGKRGSDLISWAFGAYERGELDGVLADSVEHSHLCARSRRAARPVRGAAPRGPVPRHQRFRSVYAPRAHHCRAAHPRSRRRQASRRSPSSPTVLLGALCSARSTTARCGSATSQGCDPGATPSPST